eukprot:Hpha_TRINITY_DN3321_c0_g1::TRINITY_DN3321_c0_g1_i1::g.172316::m.172316
MRPKQTRRPRVLGCRRSSALIWGLCLAAVLIVGGRWRERVRVKESTGVVEGWVPDTPPRNSWNPPRMAGARPTAAGVAAKTSTSWPPEVSPEPILKAMRHRPPAGHRSKGKRFPQACLIGSDPEVGERLQAAEGRPGAISGDAVLERVMNWSKRAKGAALSIAPDTRLSETMAEVPVAKEEWLWKPWPTADGQCTSSQCERGWAGRPLQWHTRPDDASGPPQVLPPQPPAWVLAASNAWVRAGQVYDCGLVIHAGGCLPAPLDENFEVRRWEDSVAVLCDEWCTGYFHFTHEHLPRLALLVPVLRKAPKLRVLLPVDRPFVRAYAVDILGISPEQIIPFRWMLADKRRKGLSGTVQQAEVTGVFARTVIVPQPMQCGASSTVALLLLRRVVFEQLGLTGKRPDPGFVVVLALRTKSRMPRGMAELADSLREAFPSVRVVVTRPAENLTVAEQVKLFHRADMVIGPHGANLANVMWMRSGTTGLEVAAARWEHVLLHHRREAGRAVAVRGPLRGK